MLRPTVQSASPSWNKAPIWGLRPDFYYCQRVAGLLMWGALSDERTGLNLSLSHIASDGQSVYLSWCRAPSGAHDQILVTVWQLLFCPLRYSHYVASGWHQQKTPFPNNSSFVIVGCLPRRWVETVVLILLCACSVPWKRLPSCCLLMNVYSGSAIPAFRRHAILLLGSVFSPRKLMQGVRGLTSPPKVSFRRRTI
jgi:hypothetical protein